MSDPGVAPQPPIAPGAAAYQKLLSGGFSAEDANQWRLQQTQKLMQGGFTPDDIDKYWGTTPPDRSALDRMNESNKGVHTATDPLEMLEAGWQMSVSGLATRGKVPDTVAPEHADLLGKVLQGTGQFVGDLPATMVGFVGGASGGAAAGAAVPGAGETGTSEVVGGVAGAGFGSAALPEALRQVMMDSYQKGEVHDFKDFWAMATHSTWETAKAGVTGAVASVVGGKVGGQVLAATAKPWLATGANMTSQALTATTVGGALDGRVPNADDFVAGAVTMLGFHAAGRMVGATGGSRFVANEAGRRVQSNLQNIYRWTGIAPWQAVKMAKTDPILQQEILAQDVNGDPVTPKFRAGAPDEPPKPGAQEENSEAAGKTIEGLLDTLRVPDVTREDLADTRGQGTQYHGATGPIGKLSEGYYNDANIYGAYGFYTTDALDVAKGYQRKSPTGTFYKTTESQPVKMFDMEAARPENEWHEFLKSGDDGLLAEGIEDAAQSHGGSPNLRQIMDAMRGVSGSYGMTRNDVQEYFDQIAGILEKEGFGGMQHTGGLNTKKSPHNVQIYFQPHEQLNLEQIPDELLPKVRKLEASGDQAISPAGAIGRYQIMPGTARQYGFDPEKLTDPEYNEQAARTILSDLNRRYRGDEDAILTAYNAGPGRAGKLLTQGPGTKLEATEGPHGWTYERVAANRSEAFLPLETQEYLARNRAMGGGGGKEPPGGGGKPPGGEEPPKQIEGPEGGKEPSELPTEARVANYLDRVGEPSTAHRPMLSGLEMELDAARRLDNQLKLQGLLDPKTQIGIEDMARSTYGSEARANHFFFRGPFDPITFDEKDGVSMKDVADEIKNIGGNKDEFNTYRVSLRTIEKAKQGIDVGVIPLKEAEANAADPNLAKYAKANEMMQIFKRGVLEYVRDSGGISQKQMDAMEALNTSHVSLRRVMGDDQPFQGGRKGFRAVSPIKRMEGSDRQIIDPWLADIDNARMMIRFADRNRAAGAVVGIKDRIPPGIALLKAPTPKATIAEPGSDEFKPYGLNDKEASTLGNFLRVAKAGDKDTFTYYRNGKPEVYKAEDPNLAALYRAADSPGEATIISKVLQIPAAIARSGIALDPSFGPRIALKHQITAFIADPAHPPPFITMLRGILDAFGHGDAFWDLARKGGLSGSITDLDKNVIQSDAQKLLDDTGVAKKLWNVATSPLAFSQMITDRLSMASRIGYYKSAVTSGAEPMKAAMNARKAYLDYDEKFISNVANTWAKYVPFFKADILGLRQGWDAVKPGRMASTLTYAALGLVLPQIALYVANRKADEKLPDGYKYTDLPQWQRDLYFTTPPIDGVRLRLGKPYNFGPLLGVPLERFLEHQYEKDPHAFDGILRNMAEPLPTGLPPAINPVIEHITNHNFFAGKPLIPDTLKDATGDMQYTEATTEPAKALSRLLGPHQGGAHLANISPIVIDNYVQDWTGTLGMDALRAVGAPFKMGGQPWQVSDIPFVHSFVVRNPGSGAQPIQDFYADMDSLRAKHANATIALRNGDMSVLTQDKPFAQVYMRLTRMEQALGIMRSTLDGINKNEKMTTDEKQQASDRIYADMIMISKAGSQAIQGMK